ncbi:MAG: hypothetical protein ACFFAH_03600 [Promethearchaeota archaeon]
MTVEASDCSDYHSKYLELAKEYYELSQKRKEIEKRLKSLKISISTHLNEDNIKKIEVVPYSITLADIESKRFDISRVKKEDPELYQKYLKKGIYNKLTVIKLNENNENE